MARSEEARARNAEMTRRWYAARSDEKIAADVERGRAYYVAHREEQLEQARARRAADPERHAKDAERHRRRQSSPEYVAKRAEQRSALRLADPDIGKRRARDAEAVRVWRKSNRAKALATDQRRRALKASAPGSFTAEEFIALCETYDHRCTYCGRDEKLTADHVIPLSRGGSNYISNIAPACLSCNSRKGTKTADEFLIWKAIAA